VLRRVAAAAQRLLSARELENRARAWQPWRGYAVMHLWLAAAADAGKAADAGRVADAGKARVSGKRDGARSVSGSADGARCA
jgi:hypothetical protein